MKNLFVFLFSVLFAFSSNAQDNKKTPIELKIKTSAVCDMCITTIEKAMAYEKGVKTFKLDVDSKILTVTYLPNKTTPEKIRKAVSEAGYDADDLPADAKAYEKLDKCCKKDYVH